MDDKISSARFEAISAMARSNAWGPVWKTCLCPRRRTSIYCQSGRWLGYYNLICLGHIVRTCSVYKPLVVNKGIADGRGTCMQRQESTGQFNQRLVLGGRPSCPSDLVVLSMQAATSVDRRITCSPSADRRRLDDRHVTQQQQQQGSADTVTREDAQQLATADVTRVTTLRSLHQQHTRQINERSTKSTKHRPIG